MFYQQCNARDVENSQVISTFLVFSLVLLLLLSCHFLLKAHFPDSPYLKISLHFSLRYVLFGWAPVEQPWVGGTCTLPGMTLVFASLSVCLSVCLSLFFFFSLFFLFFCPLYIYSFFFLSFFFFSFCHIYDGRYQQVLALYTFLSLSLSLFSSSSSFSLFSFFLNEGNTEGTNLETSLTL